MLETSTAPSTGHLPDISFFADVFRDSAIATLIMGPDSRVMFWNAAMERLFGWSAEEAIGRPLPLVPPERWKEHLLLRRRTQDGKGFSRQQIIRRDKEGRPVEVNLSTWPIRGAEGQVIAIVGIYADVQTPELRFRSSLAERQLKEIERLYATAPVGLCFLDTDLRFVRVNKRLAQIDGLAAEAHVGRRLVDVAPEVAASLEDIYHEVIATGMPFREKELRAATPALPGVPRVWQVSAFPLKDPDGTVLGVTVAVSDITESKHWSEERDRQEALLRLVIDGLPGMVFYVDRHKRYRFANRAAEEWFARPTRDFEGRKISETLGEATFESIRERVDRALRGEEVEADFHFRYPDRERDVRAHYVPDRCPDGEIRGMVAFVQDVTEQKKAERALRGSEERFRRMVEIAVEGIWIVDTTARTTFVNNRMADILGYTSEEMLGRHCFEFFDSEERETARLEFEGQRNELRNVLTVEPREHHLRHKDGSSVWLDITATPMTDDSGAFTGVLKMCADVTERKKNEQRLRQAQKLETLGILAGGVAHDFNNLLTAIIGNASLVLERTEPANSSRMMLQAVITASERAAQLTRQLLTYAGKDQGKRQPLDLAAIVRELTPLLTAIIPKMVNLSLEEEGVRLVEADPAQLQHVMMNLVINAAESIPANTPGEVKIAVCRHTLQPQDYQDAVVPIEMSDREYVSFRVMDNGDGMDAATQSRIFDPFFTTKFQGRGLGLAAVLGIVKGLGGTLTVRSAPGQGSEFTVLLPAIQAASAGVELPRRIRRSPGAVADGLGTILFVDDDAALRAIAQQTLEEYGYRVLLAENGREAIAVASAHPEVRAVVLDMAMPVMGGNSAGPILRALRPDMPLILSSGYPEWDALERIGSGVAAAFLEKPYQPGALAAKVEEVLRVRPDIAALKTS